MLLLILLIRRDGLVDDAVGAEYLLNLLESGSHLLHCVCGHQREADESVVGSHGGRNHRVYKDALFKKVAGDCECLIVVAYEQRDNRSRSITNLNAHIAETVESIVGKFPEVFLTFGFLLHKVDGSQCGSCRCGSDARGEDI